MWRADTRLGGGCLRPRRLRRMLAPDEDAMAEPKLILQDKLAPTLTDEAPLPESSLRQKIKVIQDRIAARGRTGLQADKAFFDWLSGEED